MEIEISDFTGCKIALFCGDKLLTILRDDKSNIPYPNTWELPGGGREGDESPFECAAREVYEELGIHLTKDCLHWSKVYPSMLFEEKESVFLVGKLRQEQFDSIVFGDEGQGYRLMSIEEFLSSDKVVPQLQGRVRDYLERNMIRLERAGAEDLETVIAIQRASFKAVYEKYQDEYDPYLEDRERIKWKLVERLNSYYYFVKEKDEIIGFLRIQTNEELTEAWLGTAAILPQYQGKGYGSEGLSLLEKEFSTITQWDLCTVLQDAGMVAFYEKNGYRKTHIEPEKEGMDMVYMNKMIDK